MAEDGVLAPSSPLLFSSHFLSLHLSSFYPHSSLCFLFVFLSFLSIPLSYFSYSFMLHSFVIDLSYLPFLFTLDILTPFLIYGKRKFMIGELRRLLGLKETEAPLSAINPENEACLAVWDNDMQL